LSGYWDDGGGGGGSFSNPTTTKPKPKGAVGTITGNVKKKTDAKADLIRQRDQLVAYRPHADKETQKQIDQTLGQINQGLVETGLPKPKDKGGPPGFLTQGSYGTLLGHAQKPLETATGWLMHQLGRPQQAVMGALAEAGRESARGKSWLPKIPGIPRWATNAVLGEMLSPIPVPGLGALIGGPAVEAVTSSPSHISPRAIGGAALGGLTYKKEHLDTPVSAVADMAKIDAAQGENDTTAVAWNLANRRVPGAALATNIVGSIVTDPFTYATFGSESLTRTGFQMMEDLGMSDATINSLKLRGWEKGLSEADKAAIIAKAGGEERPVITALKRNARGGVGVRMPFASPTGRTIIPTRPATNAIRGAVEATVGQTWLGGKIGEASGAVKQGFRHLFYADPELYKNPDLGGRVRRKIYETQNEAVSKATAATERAGRRMVQAAGPEGGLARTEELEGVVGDALDLRGFRDNLDTRLQEVYDGVDDIRRQVNEEMLKRGKIPDPAAVDNALAKEIARRTKRGAKLAEDVELWRTRANAAAYENPPGKPGPGQGGAPPQVGPQPQPQPTPTPQPLTPTLAPTPSVLPTPPAPVPTPAATIGEAVAPPAPPPPPTRFPQPGPTPAEVAKVKGVPNDVLERYTQANPGHGVVEHGRFRAHTNIEIRSDELPALKAEAQRMAERGHQQARNWLTSLGPAEEAPSLLGGVSVEQARTNVKTLINRLSGGIDPAEEAALAAHFAAIRDDPEALRAFYDDIRARYPEQLSGPGAKAGGRKRPLQREVNEAEEAWGRAHTEFGENNLETIRRRAIWQQLKDEREELAPKPKLPGGGPAAREPHPMGVQTRPGKVASEEEVFGPSGPNKATTKIGIIRELGEKGSGHYMYEGDLSKVGGGTGPGMDRDKAIERLMAGYRDSLTGEARAQWDARILAATGKPAPNQAELYAAERARYEAKRVKLDEYGHAPWADYEEHFGTPPGKRDDWDNLSANAATAAGGSGRDAEAVRSSASYLKGLKLTREERDYLDEMTDAYRDAVHRGERVPPAPRDATGAVIRPGRPFWATAEGPPKVTPEEAAAARAETMAEQTGVGPPEPVLGSKTRATPEPPKTKLTKPKLPDGVTLETGLGHPGKRVMYQGTDLGRIEGSAKSGFRAYSFPGSGENTVRNYLDSSKQIGTFATREEAAQALVAEHIKWRGPGLTPEAAAASGTADLSHITPHELDRAPLEPKGGHPEAMEWAEGIAAQLPPGEIDEATIRALREKYPYAWQGDQLAVELADRIPEGEAGDALYESLSQPSPAMWSKPAYEGGPTWQQIRGDLDEFVAANQGMVTSSVQVRLDELHNQLREYRANMPDAAHLSQLDDMWRNTAGDVRDRGLKPIPYHYELSPAEQAAGPKITAKPPKPKKPKADTAQAAIPEPPAAPETLLGGEVRPSKPVPGGNTRWDHVESQARVIAELGPREASLTRSEAARLRDNRKLFDATYRKADATGRKWMDKAMEDARAAALGEAAPEAAGALNLSGGPKLADRISQMEFGQGGSQAELDQALKDWKGMRDAAAPADRLTMDKWINDARARAREAATPNVEAMPSIEDIAKPKRKPAPTSAEQVRQPDGAVQPADRSVGPIEPTHAQPLPPVETIEDVEKATVETQLPRPPAPPPRRGLRWDDRYGAYVVAAEDGKSIGMVKPTSDGERFVARTKGQELPARFTSPEDAAQAIHEANKPTAVLAPEATGQGVLPQGPAGAPGATMPPGGAPPGTTPPPKVPKAGGGAAGGPPPGGGGPTRPRGWEGPGQGPWERGQRSAQTRIWATLHMQNAQRALETNERLLTELLDKRAAGVLEVEDYRPRVLTKWGKDFARKFPTMAEKYGITPDAADKFLAPRHVKPKATLREINDELRTWATDNGMKAGNFFEPNPIVGQLIRTQSAYTSIYAQEMVQKWALIKDAKGQPIFRELATLDDVAEATPELVKQLRGEKQIPEGWRTDTLPMGEDGEHILVAAPIEVIDTIKPLLKISDPNQVLQFYDAGLAYWKAMATVPVVPLPTGVGFHIRNMTTNVAMNWISNVGIRGGDYIANLKLQYKMWRSHKLFGSLDGRMFSEAELALIERMSDEGTFRPAFMGQLEEQGPATVMGKHVVSKEAMTAAEKKTRLLRKYSLTPIRREGGKWIPNIDTWWVNTGAQLGGAVETNARMAHFVAAERATGDSARAGASMRKWLFDYGDLAPFEKNVMRRVMPFYTFTRKVIPRVAEGVLANPRKLRQFEIVRDALGAQLASAQTEEERTHLKPHYLDQYPGIVPITPQDWPKWAQKATGWLTGNPEIGYLQMDTPFDVPFQQMDAWAGITSDMIEGVPGLRRLPDSKTGWEDFFQTQASMLGGPVAGLAKAGAEVQGGRDFFSGAPIRHEPVPAPFPLNVLGRAGLPFTREREVAGQGRKETISSAERQFLYALLPQIQKWENTRPYDQKNKEKVRRRWLSSFTGFGNYPVGPQTESNEAFYRQSLIDQFWADYRARTGNPKPEFDRKTGEYVPPEDQLIGASSTQPGGSGYWSTP
jgi:hypothetical protein